MADAVAVITAGTYVTANSLTPESTTSCDTGVLPNPIVVDPPASTEKLSTTTSWLPAANVVLPENATATPMRPEAACRSLNCKFAEPSPDPFTLPSYFSFAGSNVTEKPTPCSLPWLASTSDTVPVELIALPATTAEIVRPAVAVDAFTVNAKANEELVPALLVAVKVTDELPAAVGVPLIAPLVTFRLSPAGKVPDETAYDVGLLLAVIW